MTERSPSNPGKRADPEQAAAILIRMSDEDRVNANAAALRATFSGARHGDVVCALAFFTAEMAATSDAPDFMVEMFHHLTLLMLAQAQRESAGGKPS